MAGLWFEKNPEKWCCEALLHPENGTGDGWFDVWIVLYAFINSFCHEGRKTDIQFTNKSVIMKQQERGMRTLDYVITMLLLCFAIHIFLERAYSVIHTSFMEPRSKYSLMGSFLSPFLLLLAYFRFWWQFPVAEQAVIKTSNLSYLGNPPMPLLEYSV